MKTDFHYIDQARHKAGLFVSKACEYLGVSRRTWFRWRASGQGPKWALVALEVLSGRLDHLGWKGFFIQNGYMYHSDLNKKYYQFEPSHLLSAVWCDCPAHRNVTRENRKDVIQGAGEVREIREDSAADYPPAASGSRE